MFISPQMQILPGFEMLVPLKDCNFLHLCIYFGRLIVSELVLNVPRYLEMSRSPSMEKDFPKASREQMDIFAAM